MKDSNFILYCAVLRTSYYQQNPKTKIKKERKIMTNTKNGSKQGMVPEARAAMDRFKMEAAADFGVSAPTKETFTTYRLTQGSIRCRRAGRMGLLYAIFPWCKRLHRAIMKKTAAFAAADRGDKYASETIISGWPLYFGGRPCAAVPHARQRQRPADRYRFCRQPCCRRGT